MFERYLIVPETLVNVEQDGQVVGFSFGVRCGYYRRLIVSMVEDLAVTVDGHAFPRGAVRFTYADRTLTLDDMETEYELAWEFGDIATLTVLSPGGLAPGAHAVDLIERLRISYAPMVHERKISRVEPLQVAT